MNDVHIRYEEPLPGGPFTVGVLLNNVSAQSTDEDWVCMNVYVYVQTVFFFMCNVVNFLCFEQSFL